MKNLLSIKTLGFALIMILSLSSHAQNVKVIKLKELQNILNQKSDSVLVVNFWATWCKPCVKEIPDFVKLQAELANTKTKFVFVNVDKAEDANTVVAKFVKKKKIQGTVLLLDDQNANYWMPAIDRHWGGSIPATLIYNQGNKKRKFFEGQLSKDELKKLIEEVK